MSNIKDLPRLINKAELARRIFPGNENAPILLNKKLKGTSYNRITEQDKDNIIREVERLLEEVKKI